MTLEEAVRIVREEMEGPVVGLLFRDALEIVLAALEESQALGAIEHSGCERALSLMADAVATMEAQQDRAEKAERERDEARAEVETTLRVARASEERASEECTRAEQAGAALAAEQEAGRVLRRALSEEVEAERESNGKVLTALQEATGSYNADNPWLGVCSAVALLKMERDGLKRTATELFDGQDEATKRAVKAERERNDAEARVERLIAEVEQAQDRLRQIVCTCGESALTHRIDYGQPSVVRQESDDGQCSLDQCGDWLWVGADNLQRERDEARAELLDICHSYAVAIEGRARDEMRAEAALAAERERSERLARQVVSLGGKP